MLFRSLVAHRGDDKSLRAGQIYLTYTLAGSVAFLAGILWLQSLVGAIEFSAPADLGAIPPLTLTLIFILCIGGLGVKAAIIPFHGWLPEAMAAPAPVSALLHAVAVVKAGVFGIVRVVHHTYGVDVSEALGLLLPLSLLAAATKSCGSRSTRCWSSGREATAASCSSCCRTRSAPRSFSSTRPHGRRSGPVNAQTPRTHP